MNIQQILSPDSTFVCDQISSKKRVLEKVSEIMATAIGTSEKVIFESLLCREKLGSTALGEGIAIPHGRTKACSKITAVFLLLETPIDYDAPDKKPVDIIFAIIVPEEADKQHLHSLAQIAELLSDSKLSSQIRHAHSSEALYSILQDGANRTTTPGE